MKGSKSKIKHDEGDTSLLTAFQAVKLSNVISSLVCSITHACYQALSYYVSFSSLQPATALMDLSVYSQRRGRERSPSPTAPLLVRPHFSSVILLSHRPLLPLFGCPTWVSLASTKVVVQLRALGTKYRSKPHPIRSHPRNRFQRASDFVFFLLSEIIILSSSWFFFLLIIPLPYPFYNLLPGKLWGHFHVLTNGLVNPLVWIPFPVCRDPEISRLRLFPDLFHHQGVRTKFCPFLSVL